MKLALQIFSTSTTSKNAVLLASAKGVARLNSSQSSASASGSATAMKVADQKMNGSINPSVALELIKNSTKFKFRSKPTLGTGKWVSPT